MNQVKITDTSMANPARARSEDHTGGSAVSLSSELGHRVLLRPKTLRLPALQPLDSRTYRSAHLTGTSAARHHSLLVLGHMMGLLSLHNLHRPASSHDASPLIAPTSVLFFCGPLTNMNPE